MKFQNIKKKLIDAFSNNNNSGVPLDLTQTNLNLGSNESSLKDARKHFQRATLKKKVGVLVTCFNNEKTISKAINTVLNQTKTPDIICVADDCSTDNSVNIIEEMASKHPIIDLVKRRSNVGVAANRDLAIRSMDCDYITTLDGDDLYFPEKVELEYLALAGDMEKVAFSDILMVTKKGSSIQNTLDYSRKNKIKILEMLTARSVPVPRDMMFSKALYYKASGFDVSMQLYEDWAFKMRLMNVSANAGWVHSGGIGTIYDRRDPGLSGKESIFLAYGQALALSRNAEILADYPTALIYGLQTTASLLKGDTQVKLNLFMNNLNIARDTDTLVNRLTKLWASGSFNDNADIKYEQIRKLFEPL